MAIVNKTIHRLVDLVVGSKIISTQEEGDAVVYKIEGSITLASARQLSSYVCSVDPERRVGILSNGERIFLKIRRAAAPAVAPASSVAQAASVDTILHCVSKLRTVDARKPIESVGVKLERTGGHGSTPNQTTCDSGDRRGVTTTTFTLRIGANQLVDLGAFTDIFGASEGVFCCDKVTDSRTSYGLTNSGEICKKGGLTPLVLLVNMQCRMASTPKWWTRWMPFQIPERASRLSTSQKRPREEDQVP